MERDSPGPKTKKCQPRILYIAKCSLIYEGIIKAFQNKHKWEEFATTHPALCVMLKGYYTQKQRIITTIMEKCTGKKKFSKGTKEIQKEQQEYLCKIELSRYLSIITLNSNYLNLQSKESEQVNRLKTRSIYLLPKEICLTNKDTYRPKVKVWKKIFLANREEKRAGVALQRSDKKHEHKNY